MGSVIESHLETFCNESAPKLRDDTYVDNVITGTNSIESAVQLYHGEKSSFREASMNLREWGSNDRLVNQFIANEDRASCDSVKALGHTWNIHSESLSLKKPPLVKGPTKPTKRSDLKEIASVFDPLGLFSPVLLQGKAFLRSLGNKHIEWDDEISSEDLAVWSSVSSNFDGLTNISIKRCVATNDSENVQHHVVCLCDALSYPYDASVYLQNNGEQESKSDLILSKQG